MARMVETLLKAYISRTYWEWVKDGTDAASTAPQPAAHARVKSQRPAFRAAQEACRV